METEETDGTFWVDLLLLPVRIVLMFPVCIFWMLSQLFRNKLKLADKLHDWVFNDAH